MSGFGRRMSMSSIFSSFSAMGGGGGGSEWDEAESVASGESDDLNMVVKPKMSKISDDDESWFNEASDHEDGKKSKKRSKKLVPKKPSPSHKPMYRHRDEDDDDTDDDKDENDNNNNDGGFKALKARKDEKSEEVDYGYGAAEPETFKKNKQKKKQSARRNSVMQFFQGQSFEVLDDADFSKIETDTEDHRMSHHIDERRKENNAGERRKNNHDESTKKKASKHIHGLEHESSKKSRRKQFAEESDFDEAFSYRDHARSKRHSHRHKELEGDDDIDSSPEPRKKKITSSMSRNDNSDSDDSERQNSFRSSIKKYNSDDGHHLCHQSNNEGSRHGTRSIAGERASLRRIQSDDGTTNHRSNEEGSKRRTRSCYGEKLVLKDDHSKRGRRSLRDLHDEKSIRSSSLSVRSRSVSSRSISRSRSRLRSRSKSVNVSPKNEKKGASLLGREETSDDEAEPDFAKNSKNQRKQKDADQNYQSPEQSRRGHRSSVDEHTRKSKSDLSTLNQERSTRGQRSVDEHSRRGRSDISDRSPERSTRGRRSMEDTSVRGRRSSLVGVIGDAEFSRRRDRSVARSAWREKEKEKSKSSGCNDVDSQLDQKAEDSQKSLSRQEILDESRKGPIRSMSRQRECRPSENRGSNALGSSFDDQSDTDDDLNYDSCSVYGSIADLEAGSGMGRRGSYLPTTLGASTRRNSTFNCINTDENGTAMRRPSLREIIKSEVLNPDKSKNNATQYNFDKIYGNCGPGMGTADSIRQSQSVPRNREIGKHEGAVDDIFKNRRLRGEVDHSRNKKGKNVKEEKKKKTLKDSLKGTFSHSLHMTS